MHTDHPTPDQHPQVRLWRPSVTLAIMAAVIATTMSCIGIYGVMTGLMHMEAAWAIPLATLFEVALFALAALARERVLAGHSASRQLVLTWVFAAASGCVSAAHDLASLAPDGTWVWTAAPPALIAAGVRLAAPLIACELWHQVLLADAALIEDRPSRAEVRTRRAMHHVASAARAVRVATPGERPAAAAKLATAYDRLLSVVPPSDPRMADMEGWLTAVAQVDALPGRTVVRVGHEADNGPAMLAAPAEDMAITAPVLPMEPALTLCTSAPKATAIAAFHEVMRTNPAAITLPRSALANLLAKQGHTVSDRHLRRLCSDWKATTEAAVA